jgi:hypothetical protein
MSLSCPRGRRRDDDGALRRDMSATKRGMRRTLFGAILVGFTAIVTCGGRTELRVPPPLPPQPECDFDEDCPDHDNLCTPVRCIDTERFDGVLPDPPPGVLLPPRICLVVDPIDCDDNDPCTLDSCDRTTGLCSYGPSTLDLDGDGHRAPLPGTIPGTPEACGDDCNDASAAAFPGNPEICDGIDNDCNGIVDDGAEYIPLQEDPTRISSGAIVPAGPGGIAFDGETYMSIYTGTSGGFDMYQTRIDASGTPIAPHEQKFTFQNADSSGGPIVWIGDRYGVAWQDRRDGDYEAYFTLLAPDGSKVIPDTRLSFAFGFSVNVSLAWTGNEFIVAWQDERDGTFKIYAQRLDVAGNLLGGNVALTPPGPLDDEAPVIAASNASLGLAFGNGFAGTQVVRFRTYHQGDLSPRSDVIQLTDGLNEAVYPTIVWNADRYVVAWFDRTGPNRAIFATTIDEDGNVLTPPTALSAPGAFRSRYPQLLPLGDRILVVYADDRDGNSGYELYSRMVSSNLAPLGPEQRLTFASFDSVYPIATFGADGDVGILFRDDREGGLHHVWFTRLGCVSPALP